MDAKYNFSNLITAFKANKKVGIFGINYLDNKLDGIHLGDLILVGARSGAGKSTISRMIAQANPKNTAWFCLENFRYDMILEQCYYYYLQKTNNYGVSLRHFSGGACAKEENWSVEFTQEIADYGHAQFDGLSIHSRRPDFNVDKLIALMKTEVELNHKEILIIDHLDYVDKNDPDENDIRHFTELMRAIRDLQDKHKVAVVAISHLRKPLQAKESPKIPSMDEFYGSSNKVKESTIVIMFSPDDERNEQSAMNNQNYLKSTFCCIRKLRLGGIDNKVARLSFNLRTGRYNDLYEELTVNYSGTKVGND